MNEHPQLIRMEAERKRKQRKSSLICQAIGCKGEHLPDSDLCDYHLEQEEEGETIRRKSFQARGPSKRTPEQIEAAYQRRLERNREYNRMKQIDYVPVGLQKARARDAVRDVIQELIERRKQRKQSAA